MHTRVPSRRDTEPEWVERARAVSRVLGREGMASTQARREGRVVPPIELGPKARGTLTSEDVCAAYRRYGVLPAWMQDWIREAEAKRPKRKKAGRGTPTPSIRSRVYERDGHQCVTCQWKPGDPRKKGEQRRSLTLDHKTPRALGGGNSMANLQTMCNVCNHLKGCKTQPEFEAYLRTRAAQDRRKSIAYREQHGQRPRKELRAAAATA